MKAFTVHDVFKIAWFTDAPCRRETLGSKKKVNELLTYAVMLDMLILAYVQIMIILT